MCKIKLYVLLIVISLITGCQIAGDKLLVITGDLESNVYACDLEILKNENSVLLHSEEINGEFVVDYTISPKKDLYRLKVICIHQSNEVVVYDSEPILLGKNAKESIALGKLIVPVR